MAEWRSDRCRVPSAARLNAAAYAQSLCPPRRSSRHNRQRDEPALPDEVSKQLREVREALSSTADELYRDGLRLSLRVAVEAPVVKAHQDAVSYFQAAAGELALFVVDKERERAGKGSGLSQSYRFSETHDRLGESMRAFMDAARTYVAPVQLTPAPVVH